MSNAAPPPIEELLRTNQNIGPAESSADTPYFAALLHDRFLMRRPGGAWSTKDEFLAGLATGAERETTMLSVELHGQFRATARCLVRKWSLDDPGNVQVFDNLRVFVLEDGRWQLISWLTEPA